MATEPTSAEAVDFYWRPSCPFCAMLRMRLEDIGLPVRELNIWEDPHAAAFVRSVAGGNETVPTVAVGQEALVNPGIKAVRDLVARLAPHLLPSQAAP